MISPELATIILVVFIVLFGIAVPIINTVAPRFVSYWWCAIVVVLAILIGAVVDFNELHDDARHVILTWGLAIVGGYIVLRTAEKALANGWLRGAKIEASKGDMNVKICSDKDEEDNGKNK